MVVFWFDGLESNDFSAWDGTEVANGGTIATESNNPHHGTYNGICTSDADADTERGRCYYDISETEVYARCYFKLADVSTSNKQINTIYVTNETGGRLLLVSCGFYNDGGTKKWAMYVRGDSARYELATDATITANQWYCGEVHWKKGTSSDAEFHLYIDGELKLSVTGETSNYTAERVFMGMCAASGSWATTMYFDCCKIANTYIGPETGESDLSANITIRKSSQADLSANVTIRNKSQNDLSANTTIQNKGQYDLSSSVTIRNKGSYDLSSNLTVMQKDQADLSCSVTIRNKAQYDLSGNFTIPALSGSADLSANFTLSGQYGYVTLADSIVHNIPVSYQVHTISLDTSVHSINVSASTHTIKLSDAKHKIEIYSEPL